MSESDVEATTPQQEQAARAARLAALATLTSGIVHEINAPLERIRRAAETLPQAASDASRTARVAAEIQDEARRCSDFVRGLLRFASVESGAQAELAINDVASRAAELSREFALDHGVHLESELAADPPRVCGCAAELEQVIVNLIHNAVQASDRGGAVWLKTVHDAAGVKIVVRDDGQGLTREELARIFDPFYTTRRAHGGAGLGLSICHAIVHEHRGVIHVASDLGQGTTIAVLLPPAT